MKYLALAALLSSACSFAFVDGPRAGRAPTEEPQCTQSIFLPLVDGAAAVFGMLASVGGLTALGPDPDDPADEGPGTEVKVAVGAVVLATAVLAVSSIYGFSKVNTCKRAYRSYALSAQQPAYVQ